MLAFPTSLLPSHSPKVSLFLSLSLSLWPWSIPHLLPLFPEVGIPCVWWSLGWPSPGSWTPFPSSAVSLFLLMSCRP